MVSGYLHQPWVQRALGVPLNWTQSSSAVARAFRSIGDYSRPAWLEDLTYLLGKGVKVALVYGDRDYACDWISGEAVSLAIDWARTEDFHASGYQDIVVNDTLSGGKVRQYGNLSFSRVYRAGHEVPYYQPEASYKLFTRALFNRDVSTGKTDTAANDTYHTQRPLDTWDAKNVPPEQPLQVCYSLDSGAMCTEDELEAISNGSAVLRDWILQDANSTLLYSGILSWRLTKVCTYCKPSASALTSPSSIMSCSCSLLHASSLPFEAYARALSAAAGLGEFRGLLCRISTTLPRNAATACSFCASCPRLPKSLFALR